MEGGSSGESPSGTCFCKESFRFGRKPESALQEFAPGSFDVITLWHVMEHLEHLNETWEMLRELLTEKRDAHCGSAQLFFL